MTNYAVGHNMAGYLPESEVWITDDFAAAKQSLIDDLLRAADDAGDAGDAGDDDEADELAALAEDVNLWNGPDCVYSEFRSGLMAWWITATDEAVTES